MPMFTIVRMRSPGDAGPGAAADVVRERVDPAQDLVDLGDDVLAVDLEAHALGIAQRRVEHGPVLADVDVLAGEHRVATPGDPDLVGEVQQCRQHVVAQQRLRQVDVEVGRREAQPVDPAGVGREPAAQVELEPVRQLGETGPRLRRRRVDGGVAHRPACCAASRASVVESSSSSQALMNFSTPSLIRTSITSS